MRIDPPLTDEPVTTPSRRLAPARQGAARDACGTGRHHAMSRVVIHKPHTPDLRLGGPRRGMSNPEPSPVYVVTGMHRSGTSATARLVAGAAKGGLPWDLRPADAYNERGYFE